MRKCYNICIERKKNTPTPPRFMSIELNSNARMFKEFEEHLPRTILVHAVKIQYVGSRYICNPPPMDTDLDILVLADPHSKQKLDKALEEWLGKRPEHNKEYGNSPFLSVRKGEVNLLLTYSKLFYTRFVAAANLCKKLNVRSKENRIEIHDLVIGDLNQYRQVNNGFDALVAKKPKAVLEAIAALPEAHPVHNEGVLGQWQVQDELL